MSGNAALTVLTGSVYLPDQHPKMQGNSKLRLRGLSDKLVVRALGVLGGLQGNPYIEAKFQESELQARKSVRLIR